MKQTTRSGNPLLNQEIFNFDVNKQLNNAIMFKKYKYIGSILKVH